MIAYTSAISIDTPHSFFIERGEICLRTDRGDYIALSDGAFIFPRAGTPIEHRGKLKGLAAGIRTTFGSVPPGGVISWGTGHLLKTSERKAISVLSTGRPLWVAPGRELFFHPLATLVCEAQP